eukprot:6552217-Alexandrium_andersonii.AAC.1
MQKSFKHSGRKLRAQEGPQTWSSKPRTGVFCTAHRTDSGSANEKRGLSGSAIAKEEKSQDPDLQNSNPRSA